MGKLSVRGRAGVGEAEGIGSESTGVLAKGRGTTELKRPNHVKREKGESLIFIMFTKSLHYILDLYIYIYIYIYTCSWDPQYNKNIKGKGKITVQYLTIYIY